jgi:hypothetical protein
MKRISTLFLVLLTCLISAMRSQAEPHCKEHKIVAFDVPGAGTAAGQGTFAYVIAPGGWIAGNYVDPTGVYHGFLRAPDGTVTKFDVPGMGTGAGQGVVEVKGITPALKIVGTIHDANNVYHGFLRTRHGKFTIFDAPDAGTNAFQGSGGLSVNADGMILGEYFDASNLSHAFLRAPDGTITAYDPPGIGTGPYQGTYPANISGINPEGASVGEYVDANGVYHGYARWQDGSFSEFDDPYAGANTGTLSLGIDRAGEISGVYIDANYVFHGYVRAPDGTMTEYDVPGAGTGMYQGTNACWFIYCFGSMNASGTIAGFYVDSSNVFRGFERTRDGKITKFDVPGAGKVGCSGGCQGTQSMDINNEGAITGYFTDKNNVVHGFVRLVDDKNER